MDACLLMSRGRLPLLSKEEPRLLAPSSLSLSFSSFSSTLAASLPAFWDAFSSCLCCLMADFSCSEIECSSSMARVSGATM